MLALADGSLWWGQGLGARGKTTGELCFNTAMTGSQEILSDPSYRRQIVVFSFPHIGNVGCNAEDDESPTAGANGAVFACPVTPASNWRADQSLPEWLRARKIPAICGLNTRALVLRLRQKGAIKAVLAHDPQGHFSQDYAPAKLCAAARAWPGLSAQDLTQDASRKTAQKWTQGLIPLARPAQEPQAASAAKKLRIAVIDYGSKESILRCLAQTDAQVTAFPAATPAAEILAHRPDKILLSNGPGDPRLATYALEPLHALIASGIPILGVCMGHQLLALALGAQIKKMPFGHHGANHPVRDLAQGQILITSQNHSFVVESHSLPEGLQPTHLSLFDQSNEGFAQGRVHTLQFHPEASPGPHEGRNIFFQFLARG